MIEIGLSLGFFHMYITQRAIPQRVEEIHLQSLEATCDPI